VCLLWHRSSCRFNAKSEVALSANGLASYELIVKMALVSAIFYVLVINPVRVVSLFVECCWGF